MGLGDLWDSIFGNDHEPLVLKKIPRPALPGRTHPDPLPAFLTWSPGDSPTPVAAAKDEASVASDSAKPDVDTSKITWIYKTSEIKSVKLSYSAGAKSLERTIKLYSFPFLGHDFGAPANGLMVQRMYKAQGDLYAQYRKSTGKTDDPPEAEDRKEFKKWCQSITGASGIRSDRQGSRHYDGSAIDIDYNRAPWVPLRVPANEPSKVVAEQGGEKAGYQGEVGKGDTIPEGAYTAAFASMPADTLKAYKAQKNVNDHVILLCEKVWKPAAEVYDRATYLATGSAASVSPNGPLDRVFDRLRVAHDALFAYFAYVDPAHFASKPDPIPLEPLKANLTKAVADGTVVATGQYLKKVYATKMAVADVLKSDDEIRALYGQILDDWKTLRPAMVIGNITFTAQGEVDHDKTKARDPRYGFLPFRREVCQSLVNISSFRWGGNTLGTDSGDMMHFDAGEHLEFRDGTVYITEDAIKKAVDGMKDAELKDSEGVKNVSAAATIASVAAEAAMAAAVDAMGARSFDAAGKLALSTKEMNARQAVDMARTAAGKAKNALEALTAASKIKDADKKKTKMEKAVEAAAAAKTDAEAAKTKADAAKSTPTP